METWIEIHGGFYEVSSLGRVRRAKPGISTFVGRPVRPSIGAGGYLQTTLGGDVSRKCYVHHLVAEAFIGDRPDGCVINHKDCNRQNNAADNLEYISQADNCRHAFLAKGRQRGPKKPPKVLKGRPVGDKHWTKKMPDRITRGEKCHNAKMTAEKVEIARKRVAGGEKQSSLAREMGISVAQMSRIIRGTRWAIA